jgi:hypothetical protein
MKSKLRIANLTLLPELKKEIKRVWIQEMEIISIKEKQAKSQKMSFILHLHPLQRKRRTLEYC